ncbi:MAG: UDP-N-acetylmuramoyl-L-alanyl-D-glutamate--2,6-diaminopimelate ligase [Clostridia bacterium]|nr:UDP-N-acetylmuramoyl-L-alanyl-D-glutamate--2,6-diaminopimelate ligase [Clostridia bacterium]
MRLGKIFENAEVKLSEKLENVEISDICYDSRLVTKGSLFVAIKGFKSDGHAYIGKALDMGAVIVVGEEDRCEENYVRVPSSRRFLATASASFFNNSAEKMKIVGITGTNGKTTTSYLIKQILELKGHKCGLIGTNQILVGDEAIDSERTTPESRELHELFDKMYKSGAEYVVMEVSSHSLELDRVYGIKFEVGVLSNLTQDHLDFHETMDNYAAAKAKLFKMSKNAAINVDDDYSHIMQKDAKNLLTYSIDKASDFKAEDILLRERGVTFNVTYKGEVRQLRLGIPGRFSVYNALAAASAALCMGFSMEDVEKGLVIARGVKGRLEVVPTITPYTVIIDYAHTPDGLENVIRAVRGFAKGRVITLFGCGGDRDNTKRPIMGAIAQRLSDEVIVTSDNPRGEDPKVIMEHIVAGMEKGNYVCIENRREAIGYALDIAKEGDVIILAGKGHETYQIFKDETIHFDEREVVKEHLSKSAE